ncbi:unnamed protein product [Macrosiphum euphorbiae]|uniref:Translocon-associated protein subunit gamma n=1 Tax=Macrosiphum euphorbiae TaxID=13131 RepID=A0AAV0XUG1_9HEMI|nr:unnamed protein product [Macrosiphum euphorbiae]
MVKKGKFETLFTEEEELLSDFSRNISTKASALFYCSAFMVSSLPIWLYWRIHTIEMTPALVWFILVTLSSTYLIAFAYKNTKFILKHKIAIKREEAVTREINRKYADDKNISKKQKDEKALFKKNDVADYEATAFSIFYNNVLFLVIVVLLSFYLLKEFSTTANYIFSVGIASGLIALFSTGAQL